ncbi:MAG: hypothetical protein JOZ82_03050 [Marmoricola sp.]|nr:hypothetical protein [Marmoricola sp.]
MAAEPPLDAYAVLDSTTWAALALVLTIIGGALAWRAWRRRGLAAGLRGLAWSLLPLAAWLTGTLELAASILQDVSTWAGHLIFSPAVWLGVAIAVLAGVLFVVSGLMRGRGRGTKRHDRAVAASPAGGGRVPARSRTPEDIEGMDEIEAILKKHGIA